MNSRIPVLALLIAGLAACGGSDPVSEQANNIDSASNVAIVPADESAAAGDTGTGEIGSALIPSALHGKWGMTPQDCTTTRGDAKGLMEISANRIRFYESVARPSPGVQTADDSVSGNFAFTGEGTNWTRYQTLELQDGKLVRTESSPMVSYTYVRCS